MAKRLPQDHPAVEGPPFSSPGPSSLPWSPLPDVLALLCQCGPSDLSRKTAQGCSFEEALGPNPVPGRGHTPHSHPGGLQHLPSILQIEKLRPEGQTQAPGCTDAPWGWGHARWPDAGAEEKTGLKG